MTWPEGGDVRRAADGTSGVLTLTADQRVSGTPRGTPCWCLPICTVTTKHNHSEQSYWMANCFDQKNCGRHQAVMQECEYTDTKRPKPAISHCYNDSITEMYVKCEAVKPIKNGLRTFANNYCFVFRKLY